MIALDLPSVSVLLLVGALAFGVVSGSNDGGTLVSLATRTAVLPPGAALVVFAGLAAVGPMILGTAVATTVAHRLVTFDGGGGRMALFAAVVAALVIVTVLTRKGLSTSLTLALMGGIAGAGLGAGLHVAWGTLGGVLATCLVAPLVAAALSYWLTRGVGLLPADWWVGRSGRLVQRAGFVLQSLAYSGNDVQKVVAILAVATEATGYAVAPHWDTQLLLGGCYALGILLGVRPLAGRIGEGVIRVRPSNAVVLEFSASAVVLASSALGAPISSTQAATNALVGSGLGSGSARVRWEQVGNVGLAWVLTLPSSIALGTLFGFLLRGLR